MRTVLIIPARYQSSRLPGKPLVKLLGKPMIIWVSEISAEAVGKENVFIATDDNSIREVVEKCGYNVIMTSSSALTGTDRIAEASKMIDADIFLNVQGDEPLLNPEDILRIRDRKIENMDYIVNGFSWISEKENPNNIHIPKVVTNEKSELVYMSRMALPGFKESKNKPLRYKKQVCIYGFTKSELESYLAFGRKSQLENHEDIEILRFLELKKKILMVETTGESMAVDVFADIENVELALKQKFNI